MKKLLLMLMGVSMLSVGCAINRNSDYATSTRQVSGFTGIDVGQGIKVNVVIGNADNVVVTAPADYIDDIKTEVKNGTLVIHWDKKRNIRMPQKVEVDVTAIGIVRVVASSGATVTTDTLTGDNLVFAASSGARINAMAKANKVTAESSSGSSVMLAGKAQNVDFDASSGASISGDKLTAANGKAEASSGASVSVSANVNLEAEASSGGRVRYSGNPTMVNVSSSSGGSISRL
ncbi:MAG: DUF2807 domain-containing protein [Salinivirgaceae bacterium]|nr:DUF2807 domain-containing protein [Salinivirgaceae bacterium]